MTSKAGTTTLALLTLLGATLLAGTPAIATSPGPSTTTAATASSAAGTGTPSATRGTPSDQQIMDAFRDEWGQGTFAPTGITDWQPVATWDRAAQYVFAPGTDEYDGAPAEETSLAPLKLDVVTRTAHDQTQYQVTETADQPYDGAPVVNYFPVFTGTPDAMEFYNAAGIPGLPAGEVQQTCRADAFAGRHFLLCRMIASDGSIRYQVKVASGTPADGLPGIDEVLSSFRDQWGTDTFEPSGATAWQSVSQWQRFRQFRFPEGTDEFTGTPIDGDPATLRPFTVWMMSRTVGGKPEFQELSTVTLEDGSTRTDGFEFDRFSGTGTDWFHYTAPLVGVPFPGAEYQLHRKVATIDGQDYLVVRVTAPEGDPRSDISYYVMSAAG